VWLGGHCDLWCAKVKTEAIAQTGSEIKAEVEAEVEAEVGAEVRVEAYIDIALAVHHS
jgi:hypothetical protein